MWMQEKNLLQFLLLTRRRDSEPHFQSLQLTLGKMNTRFEKLDATTSGAGDMEARPIIVMRRSGGETFSN